MTNTERLLRSIDDKLNDLRTLVLYVLGPDAEEHLLAQKKMDLADLELNREITEFEQTPTSSSWYCPACGASTVEYDPDPSDERLCRSCGHTFEQSAGDN